MNSTPWDDALWGLAAITIDSKALKGIWLKSYHGPVTQEWLDWLYALRKDTVKIPANIDSERLLGGLDLALTLQMGRPAKQSGVLAASSGKLLLCPMAERLVESSASILTQVLDSKLISSQFGHDTEAANFGFIAIDESTPEECGISSSLSEQLGIWLDLTQVHPKQFAADETLDMLERVERALKKDPLAYKENLEKIQLSQSNIKDLCELAQGFGINSLRAPWYASRLAKVLALLRGSETVEMQDLGKAARLVLTPRAKTMPAPTEEETTKVVSSNNEPPNEEEPIDPPPAPERGANATPQSLQNEEELTPDQPLEDNESKQDLTNEVEKDKDQELQTSEVQKLETSVLEAAIASLPVGLLKQLAEGKSITNKGAAGRVGNIQKGAQKGRPLPAVKGLPQNGHRLHVLATLRHAAPRQKIRELTGQDPLNLEQHSTHQHPQQNQRERQNNNQLMDAKISARNPRLKEDSFPHVRRLKILSEDFHIQRFAKRSESCIIFCIDASGSAALERLAEAKGAVELLLKDSYARRDHICVIGFRDKRAQVHLPATRSLVRAKRELQALPGGGGTPLASAIKLALQTSLQARHHGMAPTLVILSDGRANVTLQGEGSRPIAKAHALTWAKQWRATQLPSIWLDTSARPDAQAQEVALAMGANYVPLPLANSQRMASAVQSLQGLGA